MVEKPTVAPIKAPPPGCSKALVFVGRLIALTLVALWLAAVAGYCTRVYRVSSSSGGGP